MDLLRFTPWEQILTVSTKTKGIEKKKCPVCTETRTNKRDTSLYINHNNGLAKCYYCDRLSFRDEQTKPVGRSYDLPIQTWRNYTNLHDKVIEFCEGRRIQQSTLIHFGVTQEPVWMPQRAENVNAIVFNYFENETVVNKKYRDLNKNFTQSKNGKAIFYNINSVIGADKVYIVEGEFDVLAMYEVGVKNVISLPSGANDNDEYWLNSKVYLDEVNHFVIAVDNDEKGKLIQEKIAHRLGKHKCTFIDWNGKDANDDLISGHLPISLKQEQRFPVNGTFNISDCMDDVMNLYENGFPDTMFPKKQCFGNFGKSFSTMEGQMTVVTGIPSHGKSNFIEWYVLNLIHEYEVKASFYSPEHSPMSLHFSNLMQKAVGKPFFGGFDGIERINKEDIKRFETWSKERLYLTNGDAGQTVDWDWILAKFEEQIFSFGINVFVIDAWNKVQMPKGYEGKDGIDRTLTRVTAFCQQNNVQIFLVAHPTKMKKDEKGNYGVPQLYDVSGSADFRNQAHNGMSIYRNFATENDEGSTVFFNLKTKMSFQGEISSSVKFRYHIPTARYYEESSSFYMFDLTTEGEKKAIDYEVGSFPNNMDAFKTDEFEKINEECPF